MTRIAAATVVLIMAASACGTGSGERTILVDFSHDEYAASFFFNFPKKVTVTQGTTLVFKQTWTGEPHTVTGGKLVDESLPAGVRWIAFFEAYATLVNEGVPIPAPEEPSNRTWAGVIETVKDLDTDTGRDFLRTYQDLVDAGSKLPPLDDVGDTTFDEIDPIVGDESEAAFRDDTLPYAFGEDGDIAQNVAQPCYLRKGGPPPDERRHCKTADQRKETFDGAYSYYNSGIIPYEGPSGNTFEVPLADDIDPGTYWFYCAIHGASQATAVEVRAAGADVPSEGAVARQAHVEIDRFAAPLRDLYRQAVRQGRIDTHTESGEELSVRGPFAGVSDQTIGFGHALINEFVPKRLTAKAGEPITWRMMGSDHTISFGVPRYFPIMEFADDGTIRMNPRLEAPAGGALPIPEQEGMGVHKVDGGAYDGTGYWSSGLVGGSPYAEYTMRISEPGTYKLACLVHPPMVGAVVVA